MTPPISLTIRTHEKCEGCKAMLYLRISPVSQIVPYSDPKKWEHGHRFELACFDEKGCIAGWCSRAHFPSTGQTAEQVLDEVRCGHRKNYFEKLGSIKASLKEKARGEGK